MFYKIENTPENSLEKDFFLVNNFLKKVPIVVDTIAYEFQGMVQDEIEKMHFDLTELIQSTFKLLINSTREFKIEQVTNPKELYRKLTDNGLTSDNLYAKLQVLDWLWEKAQKVFVELRGGKFDPLFTSLINQLKSLLSSILSAIGFNTDVFEELFELLMSIKVMCNTELQEK